MVLKDEQLLLAEQEILATLRAEHEPLAPHDLIISLKEKGYPDDIVRTAIWYLVDRMQLALTPEFDIKLGTGQFAAAD